MSDYVYESGLSTKRRRQRRTAITLGLTFLLLFSAFWWAWSYIRSGDETVPTAEPTETPITCEGIADPREITINVYNATQVTGLAGRVANELRERGFTVGAVSNDPLGQTLEASAAVRYGEPGVSYAETFKTIVNEPALQPDERPDAVVDFVLGNFFTELNPAPAGTPTC